MMRQADETTHGDRRRGLIVVLWRAGLRIHEALALAVSDLSERRGAMLVRHDKGDKRREVGMDNWGWEQLKPWLTQRATMPVGELFCVVDGPSLGRPWTASAARDQLRRLAVRTGVRRRFAPTSYVTPMPSRWLARACRSTSSSQLGHTDLGVTWTYLQGSDNAEIVNAVQPAGRR